MAIRPQYGETLRGLAFLGALVEGSAIAPAPVPRGDAVGDVPQIWTITVGAATNDAVYGLLYTSSAPDSLGLQILIQTARSDGSATVAEIVSLIEAAIYNSPSLQRLVASVATTATEVIVTFKEGQSGTFTFDPNPNTDLSGALTQSAQARGEYLFGRGVEVLAPAAGIDNEQVRPFAGLTGLYILGVTTNTPGETIVINLVLKTFEGVEIRDKLEVVAAASSELTVDALITELGTFTQLAAVADFVDATFAANIELAAGYQLFFELSSDYAASALSVIGSGLNATDIPQTAVVYSSGIEPTPDVFPSANAANGITGTTVPTLDAGEVMVEYNADDSAIQYGAPAYIETADGANKGKFYATPTLSRVPALIGPSKKLAYFGSPDPNVPNLIPLRMGS